MTLSLFLLIVANLAVLVGVAFRDVRRQKPDTTVQRVKSGRKSSAPR